MSRFLKSKPRNVSIQKIQFNDILSKFILPEIGDLSCGVNTCYDNAAQVCLKVPECIYILGRVYSEHRVVDHAWNEFRGIQFDLTREIFALETLGIYQWQEISRLGTDQLKMLLNQEYWAPSLYDLMASTDVNIEI